MMKLTIALGLFLAAYTSASEILPSHQGNYLCRCLHEGCKESAKREVSIVIDAARDRIAIDYGDELQSGAPARTKYPEGSMSYTLASRGTVSFTATGEMRFGWGKLWTCQKQP